ncbi:MAG: FAD-dependent oxidoreductase [Desulfovibrionaceae bacterium]|nr:FAD-dependent oxidoreductase [Desulfovibrionaceae bacterium]
MAKLVYGVFDDVPYDNRDSTSYQTPPEIDLEAFNYFNKDNPIALFCNERGFLVFDAEVSLLLSLQKHFEKVAAGSCGKCSPCRTGSALVLRLLNQAVLGKTAVDWELMQEIATQMVKTSLCGVGKTGPIPLLGALKYFRKELQPTPPDLKRGFFSTMTSPCIEACPGLVNIPRYIDYIKDGHTDLSANLVLRHYPLVGSCGRVCVRTCEQACQRAHVDAPISIRNLKRFAADQAIAAHVLKPEPVKLEHEQRVAIVGAGPVGIACSYHLLSLGYPCDIFEAKAQAGGMIRYGIPIYRLPKDTLQEEINIVLQMGGKIIFNQCLGRDFHIDDLFKQGYAAVFLACGCPQGSYLGMPDEDTSLATYENGIEFLERVYAGVEAKNPPVLDGDVVVVGGGNVAMDCCRAAVRIAKGTVHVIYRRTEADAPADKEEIAAAKEEGVQFHFLCGQDSLVVENGKIVGLKVQDMEQTDPDASGRRGVRPIANSSKILPCQHVIAAIGQRTDPKMLCAADKIEVNRKNCVVVNAAQETSRPGVFAAGDCTAGPRAQGPTTLIMGMGQAYFAARSIERYLRQGEVSFDSRWRMTDLINQGHLMQPDKEPVNLKVKAPRVPVRELPAADRCHSFAEVEQTMTPEEAWSEAARCLRCYRIYSVVTAKHIPGGE